MYSDFIFFIYDGYVAVTNKNVTFARNLSLVVYYNTNKVILVSNTSE